MNQTAPKIARIIRILNYPQFNDMTLPASLIPALFDILNRGRFFYTATIEIDGKVEKYMNRP